VKFDSLCRATSAIHFWISARHAGGAPSDAGQKAARRSLDISDSGFGALYVDNQPCNRESYKLVTSQLMRSYGVPRTAASIRLESLGLLPRRPHYRWLEQFNLYWPRPTILNSYTPNRLLPDSSNDYLSRVLPENSRRGIKTAAIS
jgi:hypothetical protein